MSDRKMKKWRKKQSRKQKLRRQWDRQRAIQRIAKAEALHRIISRCKEWNNGVLAKIAEDVLAARIPKSVFSDALQDADIDIRFTLNSLDEIIIAVSVTRV